MRYQRLALVCVGGLAVGLAAAGRVTIDRSIAADLREYEYVDVGEPFAPSTERLAQVESAGRAILPLHREKGKPARGDWLFKHPEDGQTFAVYRGSAPNRPNARRTTLYLQPWGEFDAARHELFTLTGEFLGTFYGVTVKYLERHGLEAIPESGRTLDADLGLRLHTSYVMGELRAAMPDDAVAVLAITTVDLTRGGNNSWVFGEATLSGQVGVSSLYRHGDPNLDFALSLRRTLRTSVHETGHMMGITHCAAFECGMNGSSSRKEADNQPTWFCPEDEMKVWLACGDDPAGRYERLSAFAESHGLEREARFWRQSRDAVLSLKTPEAR
jgi:archaemetzincin